MSLLGVPRAQLHQIRRHYARGVVAFIQECIEAVFGELSLADNYFWRVYLTGRYTSSCCPEYLKEENFEQLKAGLADRVEVYTGTVSSYLRQCDAPITKFVLLDHMDWLSTHAAAALAEEWQFIVDRAASGARVIWRSGGLFTDFVDPIEVLFQGRRMHVGDLLSYDRERAARLHKTDRVHTYGNFYIADLATA
jgi:S-adenosylmethionine-diacylglycerol 3-amino-3-carboxypropyl transferase